MLKLLFFNVRTSSFEEKSFFYFVAKEKNRPHFAPSSVRRGLFYLIFEYAIMQKVPIVLFRVMLIYPIAAQEKQWGDGGGLKF